MTSCPQNVWNHTSGCACTTRPLTGEAPSIDLLGASIHDVFDDPEVADEAAEFEFDWTYMDFDDHNGYSAYDPDAPRLTRMPLDMIQVGDQVHVPGTTSIYRPAMKVARNVGGPADGTISIWTTEQDPSVDEPMIRAAQTDTALITRPRPSPDLCDPQQFNRELARRTYDATSWQASRADERHDVVRIAERTATELLPVLVHEALAQRASR